MIRRFNHWLDHCSPMAWVGSALLAALLMGVVVIVVVVATVGY